MTEISGRSWTGGWTFRRRHRTGLAVREARGTPLAPPFGRAAGSRCDGEGAWSGSRRQAALKSPSRPGGVLVSLGGDIAVAGVPPCDGWPIRVADYHRVVRSPDSQLVRLLGGVLATSSVTCRRWRQGGRELHHVVDPANGLPISGPWRTASVAAPNCAEANAASTAALVAGDAAVGWLETMALPARLAHDGVIRRCCGWPASEGGRIGRSAVRDGRVGSAGRGASDERDSVGSGRVAVALVRLPRQRPRAPAALQRDRGPRRGDPVGSAPRSLPRFAVAELHRTLLLFAVALLALHVFTAILDPFVSIGWFANGCPVHLALPDRRVASETSSRWTCLAPSS